ncbi:MAG TPA: hypothetical protein VIM13_05825 [Clostridia bacterium]
MNTGRFHLKSLLLGIGIGIIITSIISLIYLSGRDPFEGISDEQIIARAEKLGMIMKD